MATVETIGIRKHFGDVVALDGVDLESKEGEFLVLLGPSGCGKTTLLRIIAGLEQPSAGDVMIGRLVVNHLPPRARHIAMVFQSYALYPHKSVFGNIAFPLKAQGMPKAERAKKVEWAATMFGIERLLGRKPRELSGGERQRVALARAMVREPNVFLLDEPLSNLDAKLRTSARNELLQFQRSVGTTTIYVTHDQVEAMGMGDRIAVMHQGKLRQLGTPQEIYDEPNDTFVAGFLGSPSMNLVEREDVIVGFRPETFLPRALSTAPRNASVRFQVRLLRVESLGSDRLLYGVLRGPSGEQQVIAKLSSTVPLPVHPGETEEFVIATRDLRFFDRDTGLRTQARSFSL
ncbi:MAG: ABC transporter ATP-binding protein [Candidatus Tectomicrobia bacterium]|nr:ABC transporter ATP-binding protein [Candidatus Tectomicrobia bacterium]